MKLARIKYGGSIHVIKQVGFWRNLFGDHGTLCGRPASQGLFDAFSGGPEDVTCDKCKATLRRIGMLPPIERMVEAAPVAPTEEPAKEPASGTPFDEALPQASPRVTTEIGGSTTADSLLANPIWFPTINHNNNI